MADMLNIETTSEWKFVPELYIDSNLYSKSNGEIEGSSVNSKGGSLQVELLSYIDNYNCNLALPRRVVYITGESGIGKTSLAYSINWTLNNPENNEAAAVYVDSIYINNNDEEKSLVEHVSNKLNQHLGKKVAQNNNTILLLDSFDELPNTKVIKFIQQELQTCCLHFPNIKQILIFSRPKKNIKLQLLNLCNLLKFQFVEYSLCEFNEVQIEKFILNVFKYILSISEKELIGSQQWIPCKEFLESIDGKEKCPNSTTVLKKLREIPELLLVARNPFILSLILASVQNLFKSTSGEKFSAQLCTTKVQVFDSFTNEWFNYQAKKIQRNNKTGLQDLDLKYIIGYLKTYAQNLAQSFLNKDDGYLDLQYVDLDWINEYCLVEPWNDKELRALYHGPHSNLFPNANELKKESAIENLKSLRSGCLINVIGTKFKFFHRSLAEYFAAKNLFEGFEGEFDGIVRNFASKESKFRDGLQRILLRDNGILSQLSDIVNLDKKFREYLFNAVKISAGIQSKSAGIIASNAISILNISGQSLSGYDFRYVQIPYANLNHSFCGGTDFSGADLSNVEFKDAWLVDTKFDGANLEFTQFDEIPQISLKQNAFQIVYFKSSNNNKSLWLIGCVKNIQDIRNGKLHEFTVVVWDIRKVKEIQIFGHTEKLELEQFKFITNKPSFQGFRNTLDKKDFLITALSTIQIWELNTSNSCSNRTTTPTPGSPLYSIPINLPNLTRIFFHQNLEWIGFIQQEYKLHIKMFDSKTFELTNHYSKFENCSHSDFVCGQILRQTIVDLDYDENIFFIASRDHMSILMATVQTFIPCCMPINFFKDKFQSFSLNRMKKQLALSFGRHNEIKIYDCSEFTTCNTSVDNEPFVSNILNRHSSVHVLPISMMKYTPEGDFLITASEDQVLCIWCMNTMNILNVFQGYIYGIRGIAFTPSTQRNNSVAIVNGQTFVKCFKLAAAQQHSSIFEYNVDKEDDDDNNTILVSTLKFKKQHVRFYEIYKLKLLVVIAAENSSGYIFNLWEIQTNSLINSFHFQSYLYCLRLISECEVLVLVDEGPGFRAKEDLKIIKINMQQHGKVMDKTSKELIYDGCQKHCFNNTGNMLAYMQRLKEENVYAIKILEINKVDLNSSTEYRRMIIEISRNMNESIQKLIWNPKSEILAIATDKSIQLWDIKDPECLMTIKRPDDEFGLPRLAQFVQNPLQSLQEQQYFIILDCYPSPCTVTIYNFNIKKQIIKTKVIELGNELLLEQNNICSIGTVDANFNWLAISFTSSGMSGTLNCLRIWKVYENLELSKESLKITLWFEIDALDFVNDSNLTLAAEKDSIYLLAISRGYENDANIACIKISAGNGDDTLMDWKLEWAKPSKCQLLLTNSSLNHYFAGFEDLESTLRPHGELKCIEKSPIDDNYISKARLFKPLVFTGTKSFTEPIVQIKNQMQQNLFLKVTEDNWIVTAVGAQNPNKLSTLISALDLISISHVYLLIEGMSNSRRFIIKAHLICPNSIVIIKVYPLDIKDLNKLRVLNETSKCQQWQISSNDGNKLLDNIFEDRTKFLRYNFFKKNCAEWAKNHLQKIGITLGNKYYNFFVVLPADLFR